MNNNINRTFIIGIGGTGYQVITSLKERVIDKVGFNDPLHRFLRFLYIDTAEEENHDHSYLRFGNNEKVIVQVQERLIAEIKETPEKFPQYSFLPLHDLPLATGDGARRIRSLGRLALCCCLSDVESKIQSHISSLYDPKNIEEITKREDSELEIESKCKVFICAGTTGGTGSGMIADVGAIVRNLFENNCKELEIYFFLIGPEIFIRSTDFSIKAANHYALLKELENSLNGCFTFPYLNKKNVRPFDYLFYAGGTSQANLISGRKEMCSMIADSIYYSVFPPTAEAIKGMRSNFLPLSLKKDKDGKWRFLNSCGVASIHVPVLPLKRICGYRIGAQICQSVMGSEPQEYSESSVQEIIDEGKTAESLGLAEILAKIENDIVNIKNHLKGKSPDYCLEYVVKKQEELNGLCILFTDQLPGKASTLIADTLANLNRNIEEFINNPQEHGLLYAKKSVANLLEEIKRNVERLTLRLGISPSAELSKENLKGDFQKWQNVLVTWGPFAFLFARKKQNMYLEMLQCYLHNGISTIFDNLLINYYQQIRTAAQALFDKIINLEASFARATEYFHDNEQESIRELNQPSLNNLLYQPEDCDYFYNQLKSADKEKILAEVIKRSGTLLSQNTDDMIFIIGDVVRGIDEKGVKNGQDYFDFIEHESFENLFKRKFKSVHSQCKAIQNLYYNLATPSWIVDPVYLEQQRNEHIEVGKWSKIFVSDDKLIPVIKKALNPDSNVICVIPSQELKIIVFKEESGVAPYGLSNTKNYQNVYFKIKNSHAVHTTKESLGDLLPLLHNRKLNGRDCFVLGDVFDVIKKGKGQYFFEDCNGFQVFLGNSEDKAIKELEQGNKRNSIIPLIKQKQNDLKPMELATLFTDFISLAEDLKWKEICQETFLRLYQEDCYVA